MAARIGTINGTFTKPGLSKNRRKYTKDVVGKAVKRMQARLADPAGKPITMLDHHGAGDDSTRIAGQIVKVWQTDNGTAKFTADLADTQSGRDILALVTPDKPFLRNVSIRGWWLGDVATEVINGVPHDVGEDLEIDGVDFTKSPGVDAARIDSATLAETTDGLARTAIAESVEEAQVFIDEAASATEAKDPKKPYGDVPYADPGYQDDGVSRYPLDSKKHIRAAWGYINQDDNAEKYTAAQLKRIKGRIKAAAKKAGIDIAAESAAISAAITESLEEAWANMSVDNGQSTVSVSGWINDPSFLAAMGKRVAMAALAAVAVLDPDNDGDIDLDPSDLEGPDDDEMDSTTATPANPSDEGASEGNSTVADDKNKAPVKKTAEELAAMSGTELAEYAATLVAPPEGGDGAKAADAKTTTDAAPAGDGKTPDGETKPADESKPERNLTDADVAAIAAAMKPPEAASATEEADKPITLTQAQLDGRLAKEREQTMAAVGKTIGRAGIRKGLVRTEENDNSPSKTAEELAAMSEDELREYGRDAFEGVLPVH